MSMTAGLSPGERAELLPGPGHRDAAAEQDVARCRSASKSDITVTRASAKRSSAGGAEGVAYRGRRGESGALRRAP